MPIELPRELVELFYAPGTVKVLATVDDRGTPSAHVDPSLKLDPEGNVVHLERFESSRTNRNLVRSIWFDQPVTVTLSSHDGHAYEVQGVAVRAHVSGPVFQSHYAALRRQLGDVDLAAVWIIEPREVRDESSAARQRHEEEKHPTFVHLDRLVRAQ
jgi:hypothetical protein